jgi:predicted ribosomally synthesized peptide with SipW-like signal peptide
MRHILAGIVIIMAVVSLATAGTIAHFSDTEESISNTLQTGSLDLQLGDTYPYPSNPNTDPPSGSLFVLDEYYGEDPLGESVTRTWDRRMGYPDGMQTGDFLESRVYLRNAGSSEGTCLDIGCVNLNYDGAENLSTERKDAVMAIEYLTYYYNTTGEVDIVWINESTGQQEWDDNYIDDVDDVGGVYDGRITLHDWELHGISGLTPPPLGEVGYLDMKVIFDPSTDPAHPYYHEYSYQGFKTEMTLIFTLH